MSDWYKCQERGDMIAAVGEMEFMERLAHRHNSGCELCKHYSTAWDTSYCTKGNTKETGLNYCYGWEE